MYLSRPAEYALRAATYLAHCDPDTRVPGRDLAKAVNIPPAFLAKIMRRLSESGIVNSRKGHHGGFLLARSPAQIRFIDILQAVDFEPAADHCLFGLGNCDSANPCPLHKEWSTLKSQIEEWATFHTLNDSLKG
jgi:Rrf2 family protein